MHPKRIAAVAQSLRRWPSTRTFQVQIPPAHNFYNFPFYELLKSYREGLILVIKQKFIHESYDIRTSSFPHIWNPTFGLIDTAYYKGPLSYSKVLPNYFCCKFLYLTMTADLSYLFATFPLEEYSPT